MGEGQSAVRGPNAQWLGRLNEMRPVAEKLATPARARPRTSEGGLPCTDEPELLVDGGSLLYTEIEHGHVSSGVFPPLPPGVKFLRLPTLRPSLSHEPFRPRGSQSLRAFEAPPTLPQTSLQRLLQDRGTPVNEAPGSEMDVLKGEGQDGDSGTESGGQSPAARGTGKGPVRGSSPRRRTRAGIEEQQ